MPGGGASPDGGAMRSLRTSSLIAVLLVAAAATGASASQVPTIFPSGRYVARGADGSLSFIVQRSQVTGLAVRMPLLCRNARTHRLSARTLAFGAAGRPTTYSRFYLPADGSANVTFVVDDNSRLPEIYLSLQLHGG